MDEPVAYIPRIRAYYRALGYPVPYEWARQDEVPLTRPGRPIRDARIGVVTTAAPFRPDLDVDQRPGAPVTGRTKFREMLSLPAAPVPDLRIVHVAYDTAHTRHGDPRSYNPLFHLHALAAEGRVGAVGPRVHLVPTDRSQRRTREVFAPEVVARCRADGLDAAVLVPICPVCHQSMALVACALEAVGIATVVMGAARDILAHVGAPRVVFSDLPLGNPCGPPDDPEAQRDTVLRALDLLEQAAAPRTIARAPHRWPGAADWKKDYANAEGLTAEEIAARRAAFDRVKEEARAIREQETAR